MGFIKLEFESEFFDVLRIGTDSKVIIIKKEPRSSNIMPSKKKNRTEPEVIKKSKKFLFKASMLKNITS
jgi:hypothetical protein